jgi:hypothetical protein
VAAAAVAVGQTNGVSGLGNGGMTPSSYYETHNSYPVTSSGNDSNSLLYDSITTISQTQNSMYTPSIGPTIGESIIFNILPDYIRVDRFLNSLKLGSDLVDFLFEIFQLLRQK